jgi:hypothetical protein
MRMQRKNHRVRLDGTLGPLHNPDAAVSVTERKREGSAERGNRLVEGQSGIDLAAIGKELGPRADAGVEGAHKQLAGSGVGKLDLDQSKRSRLDEFKCQRAHRTCRSLPLTGQAQVVDMLSRKAVAET